VKLSVTPTEPSGRFGFHQLVLALCGAPGAASALRFIVGHERRSASDGRNPDHRLDCRLRLKPRDARRSKNRPAAGAADKRDRAVNAPARRSTAERIGGGRACGGIYFKLAPSIPTPRSGRRGSSPIPPPMRDRQGGERRSKTATAFFDAAERFLIADRNAAPTRRS